MVVVVGAAVVGALVVGAVVVCGATGDVVTNVVAGAVVEPAVGGGSTLAGFEAEHAESNEITTNAAENVRLMTT